MVDNVLQFPKSTQKVMDKTKSGEKVTRQQALNALGDTHEILNNALGRVAQAQVALEEGVGRIDTNTQVLFKLLLDKKLITTEDWDAAWKKYVLDPADAALTKHIEFLKTKGGEEAYFASVMDTVRSYTFAPEEVNGQPIDGETIKGYYMQMLISEKTRKLVLGELITKVPGLPTYTPEVATPVTNDLREIAHPDCHYCGLPTCEFCNPTNVILSE